MNFDLTEEQRLIQETARDFAAAELEPATKNRLSHRGKALAQLAKALQE